MSKFTGALATALFALFALGVFVSTGPWKTPAEVSFGVLHALGVGAAQPPTADAPPDAPSAPTPLSASGTAPLQR